MTNDNNSHELIVSGIHFDLTPAIKTFVHDKMERLFRHDERIVRIRVELEYDSKHDVDHKFVAKAHIVIHGPDINATAQSDDCYKSIDLLVDKLDGILRQRHSHSKAKRNHPHAVEFDGVDLPKAI